MSENHFRFDFTSSEFCLNFANTVNQRPSATARIDRLDTYKTLLSWSVQAAILTPEEAGRLEEKARANPPAAAHVLAQAKELREDIFRLMMSVTHHREISPSDLDILNSFLAPGLARTRLERDPVSTSVRWTTPLESDSLDQMFWPIARSAADLLVSGRISRVRRCRGEDCDWLFMDDSKNQTKEWCKMSTCGNRAKLKRYRARTRQKAGIPTHQTV